jgi:hypothetical protein
MVLGDNIDSKVEEGAVPCSLLRKVVQAILNSPRKDYLNLPSIFKLIEIDSEGDAHDREEIARLYHDEKSAVPKSVYDGALKTLRWAYGGRDMPVGQIDIERVTRTKKTKEKPGKLPEKPTETPPPAKTPKPEKSRKEAKKTETVPFLQARNLLYEMTGRRICMRTTDVENEMVQRGMCAKGELTSAFRRGEEFPKKLFDLLTEFYKKYDERISGTKNQAEEWVPYFALAAITERMEDKEDGRTIDNLLKKAEPEARKEIKRALAKKTPVPQDAYSALLRILTPGKEEAIMPAAKKEYDPAGSYSIGQILKMPEGTGVVIDKPEKDRILVVLEAKESNGSNITRIYVEKSRYYPGFASTRNPYEPY